MYGWNGYNSVGNEVLAPNRRESEKNNVKNFDFSPETRQPGVCEFVPVRVSNPMEFSFAIYRLQAKRRLRIDSIKDRR